MSITNNANELLAKIQNYRQEKKLDYASLFVKRREEKLEKAGRLAEINFSKNFYDSLPVNVMYYFPLSHVETVQNNSILFSFFCLKEEDVQYIKNFCKTSECKKWDKDPLPFESIQLKKGDSFLLEEKAISPFFTDHASNLFGTYIFMLRISATNGKSGWVYFLEETSFSGNTSFFTDSFQKTKTAAKFLPVYSE